MSIVTPKSSSSWRVSYTFAPHHLCWEKAAAAKQGPQEQGEHERRSSTAFSKAGAGPQQQVLSSYRSDIDMTVQLMDIKSFHLDRHEEWTQAMYEKNFARPKKSSSCNDDEMFYLKSMVVEAVSRQKYFNSSALSARVSGEAATKQEKEEQLQQQQEFAPFAAPPTHVQQRQQEEAEARKRKSQVYIDKAFDLDFVGRTLLADIETVYKRYGYKTTLDGLKNLRLWDLS